MITIVTFVFLSLHINYVHPDCMVNINNDVQVQLPLLLKLNGNDYEYFLPSDCDGNVKFSTNEEVHFACPKGKVRIKGESTNFDVLTGKCVSNTKFKIDDKEINIREIDCTRHPFHEAKYTGNSCLGEYREISIGFKVLDKHIRHLSVCFDDKLKITKYVANTLSKSICGLQVKVPRPNFLAGNFYKILNFSVDSLYKRNHQRDILNSLIGLPSDDLKYVHDKNNFFLARGHLVPKQDFVYASGQRATFYFINVIPQWNTLNSKNWNKVESKLQEEASRRNTDLEIYTGTEGIMTLPNESTQQSVEIYLYAQNKLLALPVPQYIWKVVIDSKTRKGVVFIGINNPYGKNEFPCTNICHELNWIKFKFKPDNGYVICCSVDDVRDKIKSMPDVQSSGLLL